MTITARFEHGVFKPLEDLTVSEGAIVEVHVPVFADQLESKSRPVSDFGFFGMENFGELTCNQSLSSTRRSVQQQSLNVLDSVLLKNMVGDSSGTKGSSENIANFFIKCIALMVLAADVALYAA